MKPAIVIAGYNRVDSITRLMKSVQNAYYPVEDVTLIVSLDHSDKIDKIVAAIEEIGWSHGKLLFRVFDERQGLKRHILSCGDLAYEYGSVIVLEDDLYVSPCFYSYILQMIDFYKDDSKICGVSLYCHAWNGYGNYQFVPQRNEFDVFIAQIGVSWGQCWTKEQWSEFKIWYEKNKEIDRFNNNLPSSINDWGNQSWAKYFYNYMVENEKYYIIPYTSLSTNFSEIGEHNNESSSTYQVMLLDAKEKVYNIPQFEQAIKYDMFFERIIDDVELEGISGKEICMNLHGFKQNTFGKKYLVTCKEYPDIEKLKSYGLRLRPIEENVLNRIEGDDIFLYCTDKLSGVDISYSRRTSNKRIAYEIYGNPPRRLEDYLYSINNGFLKELDSSIWNLEFEYGNVQNRIIKSIEEYPSTGWTWMFHNVSPKHEWDDPEYSIEVTTFEELIKNRIDNGYVFKSIYNVFDSSDERSIFLTFDDGYKGVYKYVMPICAKYSIPFCVFITVGFLGKKQYINDDELKSLCSCNLCTIGAHSMSHPMFRYLSEEDIRQEMYNSKTYLENITKKEIDIFAYPYGSVYAIDERSFDIAKETGFNMAFSTIGTHNVNTEKIRYFLPRINVNEKTAIKITKEE